MWNKIKEIQIWMNKIRTWWKQRNIAEEIAETVRQHTKKVAKATKIYWKHFPYLNIEKMIKMAKYHDVAEYKEKDYTPWEISQEKKHQREKFVISWLKEYFWEKWDELYDIWIEFEEEKTPESKIVKQLDKLDAAIQAMEYQKLWYKNVINFYDYTLWKLSDPVLINILKILLKKEFNHIKYYDQYFFLLEHNWNEEKFKNHFSHL